MRVREVPCGGPGLFLVVARQSSGYFLLFPLVMPLGCGRTWRRATVFFSWPLCGGIARVGRKEKKTDQSWSVASDRSYASRGQVIGFDARPGGVCLTIASARPFRVLCGRDCAILSVVNSVLLRGHSGGLEVRSGSVCGTIAIVPRLLFSRDCAIVGRVRTHDARGHGGGRGSQRLGSRRAPRPLIIAWRCKARRRTPLSRTMSCELIFPQFSIIISFFFSASDSAPASLRQHAESLFSSASICDLLLRLVARHYLPRTSCAFSMCWALAYVHS